MKISSIHLTGAGPIEDEDFDLTNRWTGQPHERILLTGPNGSGKSTILRGMAHLWQMAGNWLATPEVRPKGRNESRAWLRSHVEAIGMVVEGVPGVNGSVGLFFGTSKAFEDIQHKAFHWIGERDDVRQGPGKPALIHHGSDGWLLQWSQAYYRMRLSLNEPEDDSRESPNMIYLEAEERRWVSPKGDPDQPVPDNPALRWLVSYRATEKWDGQLEASLIALKTLDEDRYRTVLNDLNAFLAGKSIRFQPTRSLRLMVDIESSGTSHPLDELSAGERQVLIQIYLISRWLQPGGVVLLDEPDLHLHPSLIQMLLGRLETMVAKRQGQLFLTSHLPEIWHRYEAGAMRIRLGGGL